MITYKSTQKLKEEWIGKEESVVCLEDRERLVLKLGMSLENLINNSKFENYEKTYASSVRKYLRKEFSEYSDPSILVLGAGIPERFPKDYFKNITAVDVSKTVCDLWKKKRVKKVIKKNVENYEDSKKYDIVVIPAVINWMENYGSGSVDNFLKKTSSFMKKGSKIIIFDTVDVNIPYYDDGYFGATFEKKNNWRSNEGLKKSLPEYLEIMNLVKENISEEVICSREHPWRVKYATRGNVIRSGEEGEEWTVKGVSIVL